MIYTHADVVGLCVAEAEACGWKVAHSFSRKVLTAVGGAPDIILSKRGGRHCALEVKPSNTSFSELRRGVGQCLCYSLYDVNPYLVYPDSYNAITKVIPWAPSVGFISYSGRGNLCVVHGNNIFSNGNCIESDIFDQPLLPIPAQDGGHQLSFPMYTLVSGRTISDVTLSTQVRELGLSARATNVLYRSNCSDVVSLLQLDLHKVITSRYIGIKTHAEIQLKQQELRRVLEDKYVT